jgi:uncharacterized membrane protein
MSKSILKALPELEEAGVLTPEIAAQITKYYQSTSGGTNRLVIVFGIIGSLLMGMGIILIIAHNWDELVKPFKLALALTPLLIGQGLCAISLILKRNNPLWHEASSVFLFSTIAASISIVSQIYNIAGDLGSFLFVWMMLSLPLVYIMNSRVTSLLVVCGVTWYGAQVSFVAYGSHIAWYYWPMILFIIPFYYRLYKHKSTNFIVLHSWLIPASIAICLPMFAALHEQYLFMAYASLCSMFALIAVLIRTKDQRGAFSYDVTGTVGLLIIFLVYSFDSAYKYVDAPTMSSNELRLCAVLSCLALGLLIYTITTNQFLTIPLAGFLFAPFIFLFLIGRVHPHVGQVGCNLIVLIMAIATTKKGADRNNLMILNAGLVMLALLVACRFFDTNISFAIRGTLFMIVGCAFFAANFYALKKRKTFNA